MRTALILMAAAAAAPALTPSVAAAPAAWVQSTTEYKAGREKLAEARKSELIELAQWCHKQKAYLTRDKVYEALLPLDPENKTARKFLKYTFDRKGKRWYRKRPYKAPKPGKPEVAAEATTKFAALNDAYVEAIMDLIYEHEEALGPVKTVAEREWLLEQAPDNEAVRESLGFVKVERKGKTIWTTQVALDTQDTRDELAELLADARDEMEDPEEDETDSREDAIDVDWSSPLTCGRGVRVSGNVDDEESTLIAHNAAVQWTIFKDLLGGNGARPRKYQIFLIEGEADRDEFVATFSGFSDQARELAPQTAGFTTGSGREVFACTWASESINRIDMACKQATTQYINFNYDIQSKTGWVIEGVGAYVNQMVVGTKLSTTVTRTEYEDKKKEIDQDIQDPDADWIEIAIEVLKEAKPTRLADTLGRNSNEMDSGDYTLSYALVSYLREGHGIEIFEEVMTLVGKREMSSVQVLEKVLEKPLPRIQADLLTYLEEVGGHDY